ncbi:MAG: metal-dependent transcriptional regulator [Candidatus Flemingiibacterium sp.]
MVLQESGEMYLETIYVLSKTKAHVHSVDVGDYMGYSKPSVSRAVGILRKGGFLTMEPDGSLCLTEAGTEVAERIYERHTILSEMLISLGVGRETAVLDACKIEHDISDESFEALKRHAKERGECKSES